MLNEKAKILKILLREGLKLKLLNIFIIFLLILQHIYSYSSSNLKFNKIENKINYLNARIDFLNLEIEKINSLMFKTKTLISKKELFTTALQERLNELSICGNHIKIRSANFRLIKWFYTYLKKLTSQQKYLNHQIEIVSYEIKKSNLDNEATILKQLVENLAQENCNHLICSINKLINKIDDLQEFFRQITKEKCELINEIDRLKEIIISSEKEFSECCCWI